MDKENHTKFEIGSLIVDNDFYQLSLDTDIINNDFFSGVNPSWIIEKSISGLHLERKGSHNIGLHSLFVYIHPQDLTFWKLKFLGST